MFDPIDPKQSFPALERAILTYWREEDTFHRSVEQREGRETFRFYDGPPFATGLPHYGHLLAGTIKDVIPRYQTMRGKKVQRRFGWDCHGLPVENLIEKERNLKSKKDIEALGIATFNELCRASVQRYVQEWRKTVERMGRWVDMDWDYRTMDPAFMESIWWVFQRLSDKGLLYEGHKPMHICPHCVTPLSNFEVTQGYKEITDVTATVQCALADEPNTYLLAWTTTPWTLPGNLFLAIDPSMDYVRFSKRGDEQSTFIASKRYLGKILEPQGSQTTDERTYFQEGSSFKGKKLVGMRYEPLFPYFKNEKEYTEKAFKIVGTDFVLEEEGTGLVHIAPGFGEDDFQVGKREKVPVLQHVSLEGKFMEAVTDFAGQDVKPIENPSKTDRAVVAWLEKHGKLFATDSVRHSYPHCWRCDSPLLNYATSSWFVAVEKIKEQMLEANAKTSWVPAHIKEGRFGKWLENARDWAISRNRYWGTPLPIWRCTETKELDVVGGRDELMLHHLIRFTKVTAVRHGEAAHNTGHFYQSQEPGVSLTKRGREQAEKAATFLANQSVPVSVIYCSPLTRTRETAEKISKATGAPIVIDDRLREAGAGSYEGKSIDFSDLSLVKLRRQHKLQSQSPQSIYHLEGMEKWEDIQARIESFLHETLPKHRSEHIVIVSHADPLLQFRHFFSKEDPFKLSHQPYPNLASPETYFWDHDHDAELDLHKHTIDSITWPSPHAKPVVDAVFVRHGETDLNRQKLVQGGEADEPLNATGRTQAMELAEELKKQKKKFDCIVSSDLKRAKETAEILCKELKVPFAGTSALLRERMLGTWSKQSAETINVQFPPVPGSQGLVFHIATPPNGESLSTFMGRAQNAYDDLLTRHSGKRILVITHRGMIRAMHTLAQNLPYREIACRNLPNCAAFPIALAPLMRRIPDVLDCWFESGSMPYAESHYPFEFASAGEKLPPGFPSDFIAEGIDQTRGWFYTLMVLSSALYQKPAFKNCVVNGIVLAEDGRKMSKRLKNYPEPTEVVEKFGADALRFALMSSPAVRGEDLRFSEKIVEETVRSVLLPLWNSYSFFVTYANLAQFEPVSKHRSSVHPLDRWIRAETQDLVNRMTEQLDRYDLSATCEELHETVDALTNWYIRLSRRRFAGKGSTQDTIAEAEPENFEDDRIDALTTLYDVLLTLSQLLAPFCPFVTEAIYLNLVPEQHGSIHLTDWPAERALTKEERKLIQKNRLLRQIVSLGLKIRADRKLKIRLPLASATVAFPPSLLPGEQIESGDLQLLRQELNVKEVVFTDDISSLGERIAMVDARKVGPRLGSRVQEVIQAGKRGAFEVQEDGSVLILDEVMGPEEVSIVYRGKEGQDIAAEGGVVVSLDTAVTEALKTEGMARDLVRAVQKLRKEGGLSIADSIVLSVEGADPLLREHQSFIAQETNAVIKVNDGEPHTIQLEGSSLTIRFQKRES